MLSTWQPEPQRKDCQMLIHQVWGKLVLQPSVANRTSAVQEIFREVVVKTLELLASRMQYQVSVATIYDANIAFLDACIAYRFVERVLEAEGLAYPDFQVQMYTWGEEPNEQRRILLSRLADMPGYLESRGMNSIEYLRKVLGLDEVSMLAVQSWQLTLAGLLQLQPEVVFMLKD